MGWPYYIEWAILLPSIIGLIYWFFTAPDPRFANAIFFLAMISSMLLFLISIKGIVRMPMYIAMFSMVFLVCNADLFSNIIRHLNYIKLVSITGWYPVKEVPLNKKVTLSGLIIYTPVTGDQCWDSPLPSTPYFNERLRLRRSGNMAADFTVIQQEKNANDVK